MVDGKRRAYICQQVVAQAKKKQEEGAPPMVGISLLKSFTKRKMMDKSDYLDKKSRLVVTITVKETPPSTKLPLAPCHGVRKA